VRLVQVLIPTGKREAVRSVLEDEGIDYAFTDETSGRKFAAVVTFPLPTSAVEPVLERLREAGIERDAYTVVVDAETVVSRHFEDLQESYEEEKESDRIAREELVAAARELSPRTATFSLMTVVSAVVATAGLLLDSPAVVVGSMVIAPLIGPAMATSVGTVLDEDDLFRRGLKLQLLGGILAVAGAALFALFLNETRIVPLSSAEVFAIGEIRERLTPDVLSLAVALGAGIAGAISLSSGVSSALVGVMIAAALVPPTAVVGIGIAWGSVSAVTGSLVLVLVNFVSINFAALLVLWFSGYRPQRWFRLDEARTATVRRTAVLGLAILVLSAFLGGVTYASFTTATFEDEAQVAVERTLSETPASLSLLSMEVQYDGFPFRRPTHVVVTVGHPPGTLPPPIASRLAARIDTIDVQPLGIASLPTDSVSVEVRFVAIDQAA
jgi:uncharacterized hydrophobic protein (TIGR00341 family)